jgi:hypothetical protein
VTKGTVKPSSGVRELLHLLEIVALALIVLIAFQEEWIPVLFCFIDTAGN